MVWEKSTQNLFCDFFFVSSLTTTTCARYGDILCSIIPFFWSLPISIAIKSSLLKHLDLEAICFHLVEISGNKVGSARQAASKVKQATVPFTTSSGNWPPYSNATLSCRDWNSCPRTTSQQRSFMIDKRTEVERGAFNKFPDFFFVQAFKIVVDSWEFTILLLYILWDDWQIFMISGLNEQLQQQLEHTPTLIVTAGEISKMQSGREDTLEEWYAIKFYFKRGKCHRNVWNTSDCFSTILHESSISFWVA